MATQNLAVSGGDAALILNGLFELYAKLDRAQDLAARNGDIGGMLSIEASRAAIGDLYARVRGQHLEGVPSLASAFPQTA